MKEYRIQFIKQDWLGLRDLDSPHRFGCRVTDVQHYVEGEIVQFGPAPPTDSARFRPITSSRIDPGYSFGEWPGLEPYSLPGHDPAFAPYYGLVQGVSRWVRDEFRDRVTYSRHVRPGGCSRICRGLVERYPLYIDPYRYLGEIKWKRGQRVKARKYLETGWKVARMAFHAGFDGTFDSRGPDNLPVFEVGTAYAKALAQSGRDLEALEILEFLRRIDRPWRWSADGIYTPLLLRAGRLDRIHDVVKSSGPPGPGHFVRALLCLEEGREEEAVRSVLMGAIWNPLFLDLLLGSGRKRPAVPLEPEAGWFSYLAALHTSLTLPVWRKRGLLPRLEAVRRLQPFSDALGRAIELAQRYEHAQRYELGNGGSGYRLAPEAFEECFTDQIIEATVRAGAGV